MTGEVDEAVTRCRKHVRGLRRAVVHLSDLDLKELLSRVKEEAEILGQGTEHLWRGLGGSIEWTMKVRTARSSPRGTWYVSVDMLIREPDDPWGSWDTKRLENRVCKGRAATEAAYRDCFVKYASKFTYDTKFEIEICPEIEWDGLQVDGDLL